MRKNIIESDPIIIDRRITSPATDEEFEKLQEKQLVAIKVIEMEVPDLKDSLILKIRKTISTERSAY